MADVTISQLPLDATLTGTEEVPIMDAGVTKKTTVQDIANLAAGGVSSVNGETGIVVLDAADVGADPNGTASGLLASHVLAPDPHPGYLTPAEGDLAYSAVGHNHNLADLTEKSYNSLTDKPTIPSVAGLLDETAHDLRDHTGLPGSAAIDWTAPVVITDTANLAYGKHYIVAVTAAGKTLTLPEITATDYGKMIVVEIAAVTTKLITIDGYSTQTIDGATSRVMWASEVAQLVATSAGWTKVGGKLIPLKATIAAISLNQLFNATTWTKLLYNTNSADAVNMVDIANKCIVVKRAAIYSVSIATLSNTASSAACNWVTSVYKNTSIFPNIYAKIYKNSTSASVSALASQIVPLASNDIIEGYAYFDAGSFTTSCIASTTNMQVFLDITEIPGW